MIGSKLLPLLSTLSSAEYRRLRKIFQSPFFTTNDRHLVLYDLLRKYHPIFDTPRLGKEQVFKKLYPGKPFNDGLLRVVIREFTEMTEEYLLLTRLREGKYTRKKMLSQIYKERNLYDFFVKETKQLLKALEQQPYRDWDYYREQYELNFEYFFHPNTQKMQGSDKLLQDMMDSLDKQFALGKWRIGSEMQNRMKSFSTEHSIQWFKVVKEVSQSSYAKGNPLFHCFLLLDALYEKGDDETFQVLKQALEEYRQQIRSVDQSLILNQLINFAIRKTNSGQETYSQQALDLYKLGLKNGLLLDNGTLDDTIYGNIISLGCHAKDFEWLEIFMLDHTPFLPIEVRRDALEFNKGVVYYHQDKFEQARMQFMHYHYSKQYETKARSNLIRTIFEEFLQDESLFDLLISQLNTFEKLLHRTNYIATYRKEAHLSLVSILKRLSNGIFQRKNKAKLKLMLNNEIRQKERIIGKKWLLEKINQL